MGILDMLGDACSREAICELEYMLHLLANTPPQLHGSLVIFVPQRIVSVRTRMARQASVKGKEGQLNRSS